MNPEHFNLKRKADQYKEVLSNTVVYRKHWKESLKEFVMGQLKEMNDICELQGEIDCRSDLENLQAIVYSLGTVKSGLYQKVNHDIARHLIKQNGSLVYQQLFNGKIIVLINYPYIENYGQPRPPKTVAIYRPEELKAPYIVRHMETFLQEITNWEDFDDDEPNKRIGFQLNFQNQGGEPQENILEQG
jgi:hypothetical protein